MNRFSYISSKVLQSNLGRALEHIAHLLSLTESESYKTKSLLISSLRKTIIIHTASIIEALLLWKLKQKIVGRKVKLSEEWKYFEIVVLHKDDESREIIAGKRKSEVKSVDKLDFLRIIELCFKHKIVPRKLSDELHAIRKLRNRLHLGGLKEMERKYKKEDLIFAFDVLIKTERRVKS